MLILLIDAESNKELHRTQLPMPPETSDIINLNSVKHFVAEKIYHIGDHSETYCEVTISKL